MLKVMRLTNSLELYVYWRGTKINLHLIADSLRDWRGGDVYIFGRAGDRTQYTGLKRRDSSIQNAGHRPAGDIYLNI